MSCSSSGSRRAGTRAPSGSAPSDAAFSGRAACTSRRRRWKLAHCLNISPQAQQGARRGLQATSIGSLRPGVAARQVVGRSLPPRPTGAVELRGHVEEPQQPRSASLVRRAWARWWTLLCIGECCRAGGLHTVASGSGGRSSGWAAQAVFSEVMPLSCRLEVADHAHCPESTNRTSLAVRGYLRVAGRLEAARMTEHRLGSVRTWPPEDLDSQDRAGPPVGARFHLSVAGGERCGSVRALRVSDAAESVASPWRGPSTAGWQDQAAAIR